MEKQGEKAGVWELESDGRHVGWACLRPFDH